MVTNPAALTPQSTSKITVTIQSIATGTDQWTYVTEFLKLRKQVFMDEMSWDLNHYKSMEYEQYDRLDAVYVLAHRDGKLLGGARLLRTDREIGIGRVRYSYMIRDAVLGILDGLPTNLCTSAPPQSPKIWELTRLATLREAGVAEAILQATDTFLKTQNAITCLFLGPPAFLRMAKSLGWAPQPLGPIVGNKDGRFLAFHCPVLP